MVQVFCYDKLDQCTQSITERKCTCGDKLTGTYCTKKECPDNYCVRGGMAII